MIELFTPSAPPKKSRKYHKKRVQKKDPEPEGSPEGWITESEASVAIGVTRQTLRNMRCGYTNAVGEYPPRLTEGEHWKKYRKSRRAPVYFNPLWVQQVAELKHKLQELGL